MKERKTKILRVRVRPSLHAAVGRLADKMDVTICQVVRWAVWDFVRNAAQEEANDEAK